MAADSNVTYLKDYKEPDYWIEHVDLEFDLQDGETFVTSKLKIKRNGDHTNPLVLDGEELELLEIAQDGNPLGNAAYDEKDNKLTVHVADDDFVLETKVRIKPEKNTKLSGLYKSGDTWCTQCEAEGFRRITYFVDRPDNMATFTTKVIGDENAAPVLLSNGNQIDQGKTADGRHYTVWDDPNPKPSYLFALVGGELDYLEDEFETMTGRKVRLRIYTDAADQDKVDFTMDSLKRSFKWDEDVYGRTYEYDSFNVVAVGDFNSGAMENTTLNIFNTALALAHPDVATDAQYQRVDGVIAHEFFHHWTGNLVTCRDWFQLCLKEGLTVFRDQSYQADHYSAAVQRIDDVKMLRAAQFKEDASPMAHPPRPSQFETINNFYTVTVYEKGAELNRMIYNLVGGKDEFRKGSDLYFQRHQGQAVTVEDWVAAHEDATGTDLSQFMKWYTQGGTPTVKASWSYDDANSKFKLTLEQDVPKIDKGVSDGSPRHIPVAFGLVGPNGDDVVDTVLELTDKVHEFEFDNVPPDCVPSILRGFSAPVYLDAPYSDDDLRFLMVNDNDGFNQWEAGNRLLMTKMMTQLDNAMAGKPVDVDPAIIDSFRDIIRDADMDKQLKALALTIPSFGELSLASAQAGNKIDPQAIIEVRNAFLETLGEELKDDWRDLYDDNYDPSKAYDHRDVGNRDVQNKALSYLAHSTETDIADLAADQYFNANNVTDRMAAYMTLQNMDAPQAVAVKDKVANDFYAHAKATQALVVDKWVSGQAITRTGDIMQRLEDLQQHEALQNPSPNRMRALYATFAGANPKGFHAEDGSGYEFIADFIMDIDGKNSSMSSRLIDVLGSYKKYKDGLADHMHDQLCRIAQMPTISKDLGEKVKAFLGDATYDSLRPKKNGAPSIGHP